MTDRRLTIQEQRYLDMIHGLISTLHYELLVDGDVSSIYVAALQEVADAVEAYRSNALNWTPHGWYSKKAKADEHS